MRHEQEVVKYRADLANLEDQIREKDQTLVRQARELEIAQLSDNTFNTDKLHKELREKSNLISLEEFIYFS